MFEPWLIAPLSAIVSMLVGLYFYRYVDKQDRGTERMQEIANAIKQGAAVFIRREYTVLAMFLTVVAVLWAYFCRNHCGKITISC